MLLSIKYIFIIMLYIIKSDSSLLFLNFKCVVQIFHIYFAWFLFGDDVLVQKLYFFLRQFIR